MKNNIKNQKNKLQRCTVTHKMRLITDSRRTSQTTLFGVKNAASHNFFVSGIKKNFNTTVNDIKASTQVIFRIFQLLILYRLPTLSKIILMAFSGMMKIVLPVFYNLLKKSKKPTKLTALHQELL